MDPMLVGLLSFALMLILIFLGLHVGTALLIISVVGFITLMGSNVALSTLEYVPYASIASYNFAVFPLFILMGEIASISGLVSIMFRGVEAWLGRFPGGLAMAVAGLAAQIGAITGSGMAACAMMVRATLPEMKAHGYQTAAVAGLIASVANLAWLIPPSVGLVFYGALTEESISKLLLAGLIPGGVEMVLFPWS